MAQNAYSTTEDQVDVPFGFNGMRWTVRVYANNWNPNAQLTLWTSRCFLVAAGTRREDERTQVVRLRICIDPLPSGSGRSITSVRRTRRICRRSSQSTKRSSLPHCCISNRDYRKKSVVLLCLRKLNRCRKNLPCRSVYVTILTAITLVNNILALEGSCRHLLLLSGDSDGQTT